MIHRKLLMYYSTYTRCVLNEIIKVSMYTYACARRPLAAAGDVRRSTRRRDGRHTTATAGATRRG